MEIHADAVRPDDRVLIVDDVIASGGTVTAALDLVERAGGSCIRISCVVKLVWEQFRAAMQRWSIPIYAIVEMWPSGSCRGGDRWHLSAYLACSP